jgi:Phage integrase SAM-like domain/Arm DNA-binding domain/Phage integrase family
LVTSWLQKKEILSLQKDRIFFMKTQFTLRDLGSTKPTPITLRGSLNGKRFSYGTRKNILPSHWNKEKERATRKHIDFSDLNNYLDKIQAIVKETVYKAKFNKTPLNDSVLRAALDEFTLDNVTDKDRMTFNKFIDVFIEEKKNTVTPGTRKQYYTFKNLFESYQAERKKTFDFEDFDLKFERDFKAFHVEKKYSTNYTGRNIKILKSILNEAVKLKFNANTDFSRYTKPQEEAFKIYLSESDLDQIQACNIDYHLEKIRDVFLFLCNTGLRYSDYATFDPVKHLLTRQQPTGELYRVLLVTTQKTSTPVEIPTTKLVERILSKYKDALPKITSKHINEGIKEIGRLAGINDTITIETKIGTTTTAKQYQKYELITTHTGRRSFCTNAYKRGVPTSQLMKLTGHKTEAVFFRYIKIGNEENAQDLANHSFFNH